MSEEDVEFTVEHEFQKAEADGKAFPRKNPTHGLGLVTGESIKVGEDVALIRKPLVAVLDSVRLGDTCTNCFGKRTANALSDEKVKLKRCTGCDKVRYCDKTCQAENWSFGHKYECPIFKRVPLYSLPINARALIQILLRHRYKKIGDSSLSQFFTLSHHRKTEAYDNSPRKKDLVAASKIVWDLIAPPVMFEEVEAMLAIMDANCFTLTTPTGDRIGLLMDINFGAYMNHSCEYNTVVGFDGSVMYAKAIRPIAKDKEVLISYIDATNPYEQRQKELKERYFFTCNCPKCKRGTAPREDRFSTTKSSEKPDVEAIMRKVGDPLKTTGNAASPKSTLLKLKTAIKVLHDVSVWPITRQPYATFRDELIASLLEAQQFQAAFVQATIRYLRIDPILWPEDHHPTRHMHNWALAKLAIYISQGADTTHDTVYLQPYEINFGLLVWMLLNELSGKSGICTVPSFQKMIEAKYDEVCEEFTTHGLNPASMKGEIKKQWAKMEKVADDGLKKDGEVVDS